MVKEALVVTMLVSGGVYVGGEVKVVNEGPAMIESCVLPHKCAREVVAFEPCVFPRTCKN